ncbi:hypothetical protein ACVWWJ_002470 [Luteibacter sp. HA06]|jgi:hypothetical protein
MGPRRAIVGARLPAADLANDGTSTGDAYHATPKALIAPEKPRIRLIASPFDVRISWPEARSEFKE